jgi:hypothetical protein
MGALYDEAVDAVCHLQHVAKKVATFPVDVAKGVAKLAVDAAVPLPQVAKEVAWYGPGWAVSKATGRLRTYMFGSRNPPADPAPAEVAHEDVALDGQ